MARDQDDARNTDEPPWHHSTGAVLGASVAALAAIVLVIWGVVALTSEADKPKNAPIDFVDPTFASTPAGTTTPSTTATITSTSPPLTTEFGGPSDLPAPSSTTSSDTTTETSTSGEPSTTRDTDDVTSTTHTRNRPRTNVTRTLYPAPAN